MALKSPFSTLVGHSSIRGLLYSAVEQGRIPPALLFAGPEGVGKRTLAEALAVQVLCETSSESDDACGSCSACLRAIKGLHPDFVIVRAESQSIKIEQIRDLVREIGARPFEGRVRVFILDDAHLMTEQGANALLKCLEEPPPTSHVILVSASPQALLPTIRSRCQLVRFGPLPDAVIEEYLRDRHGLPEAEARLRATLAGGSIGAALAFDGEVYRALRDELLQVIETLPRSGVVERMEVADTLSDSEDLPLALTVLRSLLRDVAVLHRGGQGHALLNEDCREPLRRLSEGEIAPHAVAWADAAGTTRAALRGNANKLLSLDLLFAQMTTSR